jgi:hypothetical protein
MPLCWIFLLKRRRALSNVSFSPTRTSANPGSPPQAKGLACAPSCSRPAGSTCPRPVPRTCARRSADRLAEHSGCPLTGQPRTERGAHRRRARRGTSARPPGHLRASPARAPRTSACPRTSAPRHDFLSYASVGSAIRISDVRQSQILVIPLSSAALGENPPTNQPGNGVAHARGPLTLA